MAATLLTPACFCMILEHEVQDFVAQLRRRQVEGSLDTAKRTAEILRLLLATQRHPTAQALLDDVRIVGSRLQAAQPSGALPLPSVLVLACMSLENAGTSLFADSWLQCTVLAFMRATATHAEACRPHR